MRDLADAPAEDWQAERRGTLTEGWGAAFLSAMGEGHVRSPGRWTDTLWTLLLVMDCGLPADHPPLREAARQFIDWHLTPERAGSEKWLLTRMDLCHLGFWMRIGSYFLGADPRLRQVAEVVPRVQLDDGGWNCQVRNYPETHHSSFHTTFNVLEGLREGVAAGNVDPEPFRAYEAGALEFMLMHKMYRSHRTGEVSQGRFTHLTYPSHWHYTVLRGLDYIRSTPQIADPRLDDPLALLNSRRKDNGRWVTEKRIPGVTFFDMERFGGESRWNTLRALRVLKASPASLAWREGLPMGRPRDCGLMGTGPQNLDRMTTIYGPTTWDVYSRLDESLGPRGPDMLYDLAAEHIAEEERRQPTSKALLRVARLRRQPDDIVNWRGQETYDHIEANLHHEVFLFLRKLEPVIHVLRKQTQVT
jgi:hypothetical protein